MNKNNNIFTYATSELSQDAFLCWLFSFAMKDSDYEPVLKACAVDFLKQFIPELEAENEIWISEVPKKQYKFVDVLLTVNDKYKVIIEDKTYTSEHDNQLKNYADTITNDFNEYKKICVYFKIGFQGGLSNVIENNYLIFMRKNILSTLEKYIDKTDNVIFKSYYEMIKSLDEEANKYKVLPVCEWDWAQINEFYDQLKSKIKKDFNYDCNYGKVNNESGGFYGLWIYNSIFRNYKGNDYELYLQCQFYSNGLIDICYKASSKSGNKIDREIREYLILKEYGKWGNIADKYGFVKPKRYGSGKTVTLGLYENKKRFSNYKQLEDNIYKAVNAFKNIVNEI